MAKLNGEGFPRNPWSILAYVERVIGFVRHAFGEPEGWSEASGRRESLRSLYLLRRQIARALHNRGKRSAEARAVAPSDPLEALKLIAFSTSVMSSDAMQEVAYRAFVEATAPCPLCGGRDRAVDVCGNCDETGRVPRAELAARELIGSAN